MGPSIVLRWFQPGHWTIGALINNVCPLLAHLDQDVNQMTLQYSSLQP